jgi:hypothetical protein
MAVSVGSGVGKEVSVFARGPNGVREGNGFGLRVTVGPISVGKADTPGPVHATKSRNKGKRE